MKWPRTTLKSRGRPPKTRIRASLLVVVVLSSCNGRVERPPSPVPTTASSSSPSDKAQLGNECFSPQDRYRVRYPEGWEVNNPEGGEPCSWFHHEPFTLPARTEVLDVAVHIQLTNAPFDRVSDGTTSGEHVKKLISSDSVTVDEREAIRAEVVHSGEALLPEDTRETLFVVNWEGGTLVASTTSAAKGDYSRNRDVLDRMSRSLTVYTSDARCSSAALDPALPEQPGLPEPVRTMRTEIAKGAVKCDYRRLEELASKGGGNFEYSFGDGGDPGKFWRSQEESGQERSKPMLYMASLLKRSYATQTVGETTYYTWPAAFSFDRWDEVPTDKKEELKPLYDEVDFQDFSRFGGYIGYRIGIDASGNWRYFVAGD